MHHAAEGGALGMGLAYLFAWVMLVTAVLMGVFLLRAKSVLRAIESGKRFSLPTITLGLSFMPPIFATVVLIIYLMREAPDIMLGFLIWLPYIPAIATHIYMRKIKKNRTTNEIKLKRFLRACLIIYSAPIVSIFVLALLFILIEK